MVPTPAVDVNPKAPWRGQTIRHTPELHALEREEPLSLEFTGFQHRGTARPIFRLLDQRRLTTRLARKDARPTRLAVLGGLPGRGHKSGEGALYGFRVKRREVLDNPDIKSPVTQCLLIPLDTPQGDRLGRVLDPGPHQPGRRLVGLGYEIGDQQLSDILDGGFHSVEHTDLVRDQV